MHVPSRVRTQACGDHDPEPAASAGLLRSPVPSRRPVFRVGFLLSIAAAVVPVAVATDALRVFHFGNSLTGASMPAWHAELGRSAGKEWTNHAWLGAGWQLWQHREELEAGRAVFAAGSRGDLTLDAGQIQPRRAHVHALETGEWDSVVLQLFAPAITRETDQVYGRPLASRKDVGDLAAAADLIALQLRRNPATRFYLYQVWAPMDPGEIPPPDRLPAWAKGVTNLRTAEFPRRAGFDYASRWLQPFDPEAKPAERYTHRTRDFSLRVLAGLRARFPELAAEKRLRLVPGGDLFLVLDARLRAGEAPGISDIRDFYTDVQHIRAGLPRYAIAALFFTCLFGASPDALDWRIYNDAARYGPDPSHDAGELLLITPERVRVVHRAIAETLAAESR